MNFNTIPLNLLTPGTYVEFDNSRANAGLLVQNTRALLIGQRLAAGSVAANVPTRITAKVTAQQAFGVSSMLSAMCSAWLDQTDTVELWAVALDDVGAGVAATGTLTFTGPATVPGTLALAIAGTPVPVGVTAAMTAAQLATATVAAINADASLPVTAVVDGVVSAQVNLTARHKGLVGNSIDVRVNYNQGEALPAGITVAIVALAGGTQNPAISTALAAIGSETFTSIVMPYTDTVNLAVVETELATRWTGLNANDGHAFTAVAGSHADASTLGDSRNSPHLTIVGVQKSPTWLPVIVSQVAAADAAEPDPARPRQTLALTRVLPPAVADRYTRAERNIHLGDGISTYTVDAGGVCRIERLVTTYKVNAQNVPDPSYRDIETLRSLSYIRFQVRARISQRFPRHKLASTEENFAPGQAIATPRRIKAELVGLAGELVSAGIIEDLNAFKAASVVNVSGSDPNRAEALLVPNLVNQLRVFAAQVQFIV